MAPQWLRLALRSVVFTLLLASVAASVEEGAVLKIEFENTRGSEGSDLHFRCLEEANKTETIWVRNGTSLKEMNHTHITVGNGWMNITNLTMEDAGNYMCETVDAMFNETITLVIYKNYFIISVVILAINCSFIILFFGCLIYKTIKNKLTDRKYTVLAKANPTEGKGKRAKDVNM